MTTQAVILAAGAGTRLRPLTDTTPKCLVPLHGQPLLLRSIRALRARGVEGITVVVGHLGERVREAIDAAALDGVTFVENERWASTNSMYSLHLGLQSGAGSCWVLECDVAFEDPLLDRPGSTDIQWFADTSMRAMDGCFVTAGPDGLLTRVRIERDLAKVDAREAKSVGILRLSAAGRAQLAQWLDAAVAEGRTNIYYDLVIAERVPSAQIGLVDVAGVGWFEIDSAVDLENAERRVR